MSTVSGPLVSSAPRVARSLAADLLTLSKPGITANVLFTTLGGALLAPSTPGFRPATWGWLALGTTLVVSGANALNMYIERDIDKHMTRTANRPLPAGRMNERVALFFGLALSIAAIPVFLFGTNGTTTLLALLANISYVLAYTPLKQKSHAALFVGAVPGAIPPLMGWTAKTAQVDPGAMALFTLMFFWQIPHFLAITMFRKADYARAGLIVMPNVLGDEATKRQMLHYTAAVLVSSFALFMLGVAHTLYLAIATVLGLAFLAIVTVGLVRPVGVRWARGVFGYSILYLMGIFVALGLDHSLAGFTWRW